jgi:hypothetical protein
MAVFNAEGHARRASAEIHPDRDRKLEAARQNGRFVASRPRAKAKTLISRRFRVTDEVDYFQIADTPEVS